MKWSAHRKIIRDFITPELRSRIDLHVTHYRKAHDHAGEAWITVDKRKVLGAGYYQWYNALYVALAETGEASQVKGSFLTAESGSQPVKTYCPISEKLVFDRGVYETNFFLTSLRDYLELPIHTALNSSNPIIKALAMVDRRVGKRRFSALHVDDSSPAIVKLFHALRSEVMRSGGTRLHRRLGGSDTKPYAESPGH